MDRESGVDKPENTVDENTDTNISKDERKSDSDDVILPRKQKFRDKKAYSTIPSMKTTRPTKEEIVWNGPPRSHHLKIIREMQEEEVQ